jgi:hypothetical protein
MWRTPQNMAHSKETENWKRAAKDLGVHGIIRNHAITQQKVA